MLYSLVGVKCRQTISGFFNEIKQTWCTVQWASELAFTTKWETKISDNTHSLKELSADTVSISAYHVLETHRNGPAPQLLVAVTADVSKWVSVNFHYGQNWMLTSSVTYGYSHNPINHFRSVSKCALFWYQNSSELHMPQSYYNQLIFEAVLEKVEKKTSWDRVYISNTLHYSVG